MGFLQHWWAYSSYIWKLICITDHRTKNFYEACQKFVESKSGYSSQDHVLYQAKIKQSVIYVIASPVKNRKIDKPLIYFYVEDEIDKNVHLNYVDK